MAATLTLDTITSSGAGITIDATKTFTVNGTLLTTGSTNVLHKTGDYPIVTGDVSGKSELVVTATTGAPRNITLPGLAVAGATTCVITIMVSADATGTDSLRVQEGTTEVWTGYQKGDFVRLCISDGAWAVLDHKETYYSYHYLTSDYNLGGSADYKLLGWTEVSEIGNTWDSVNSKLVTPTDMNGYWNIQFGIATTAVDHGVEPRLYVGGAVVEQFQHYASVDAPSYNSYAHGNANVGGEYYATSTQAVEFYIHNSDTAANNTKGTLASATHFTARFNRVY
jgi:hypothetical protein